MTGLGDDVSTLAGPISGFELGRVIERTFSSVRRNFPVFLLLSILLAGLPNVLTGGVFVLAAIGGAAGQTAESIDQGQAVAIGLAIIAVVYLVGAIAAYVLQAAIVYGAIVDLNGGRASFAECLSTGLRHWFWLLLLAIVMTLGEILGYFLFIVPGLIAATAWIVAVPAQVVEQKGVFDAIGRSAELTRGRRWPIFGLLVIYLIAASLVQGAVSGFTAGFAGDGAQTVSVALAHMVVQPLVNVATSLIGAAGVASIYYELRSDRDGIAPEALAAVFD